MSHFITLLEAKTLTADHRANREKVLDAQYQGIDMLPLCETFNRADIDLILGQSGCESLRIYYGMDTNMKIHAVIVGVNGQNEDMIPTNENTANEQIAEKSIRCPTSCPPASALNQ
jgi:hypothetical protein